MKSAAEITAEQGISETSAIALYCLLSPVITLILIFLFFFYGPDFPDTDSEY